ncbi:MAG: hypothetical protein PHO01_05950 [Desulfotomaculaceae bacterium]|nr:hypothetical protein [Desulfotomaculaceae bacterium]
MDSPKETTAIPVYYSTFNKFMEEYFAFLQNKQPAGACEGPTGKGIQNIKYEPVFIPLCIYPGLTAHPPGNPALPVSGPGAGPVYQPLPFQSANNAYILFLILILLILGTRKEQILAAISSIFNYI